MLCIEYLAGDLANRFPSMFLFLLLYISGGNVVQSGCGVERDTLQHSWEPCWTSVLHLVFCQNNSDSMLMLLRRRVPILNPVLGFPQEQMPYVLFCHSHMSPPLTAPLKRDPAETGGKTNRFFFSSLLLMCFCVQKPAQLRKEQSWHK